MTRRYFSGIVLTFTPRADFTPSGQPADYFPRGFLHPHLLLEAGRSLIEILLLGGLLDVRLWVVALPLAAAYLLLRFGPLSYADAAPALFRHLLSLPQEFFSRYYQQELVARVLLGIRMGALHQAALEGPVYALRALMIGGVLLWLSPYGLGALLLAGLTGLLPL